MFFSSSCFCFALCKHVNSSLRDFFFLQFSFDMIIYNLIRNVWVCSFFAQYIYGMSVYGMYEILACFCFRWISVRDNRKWCTSLLWDLSFTEMRVFVWKCLRRPFSRRRMKSTGEVIFFFMRRFNLERICRLDHLSSYNCA